MSVLLLLGVGLALGLFYGVFAGAALAYGLTHHPPRTTPDPLLEWPFDDWDTIDDRDTIMHHCGQCGAELQAVRPGKYQHPNEREYE